MKVGDLVRCGVDVGIVLAGPHYNDEDDATVVLVRSQHGVWEFSLGDVEVVNESR